MGILPYFPSYNGNGMMQNAGERYALIPILKGIGNGMGISPIMRNDIPIISMDHAFIARSDFCMTRSPLTIENLSVKDYN